MGLLPEQGHEGTVTYQAVNTSLAAPAEVGADLSRIIETSGGLMLFRRPQGVQNHDLEHNPPQEHMVREAPAISGLLGNLIPMYAQGGYNVDRVKLVASMPSANPPVPGDRGRMAAPHGHRSEPCIDVRMHSRSPVALATVNTWTDPSVDQPAPDGGQGARWLRQLHDI